MILRDEMIWKLSRNTSRLYNPSAAMTVDLVNICWRDGVKLGLSYLQLSDSAGYRNMLAVFQLVLG